MEMRLRKISNKYRFGEDKRVSLGTLLVRISIFKNMVISKTVDVVQVNVLIGLNLSDE